MLFSNSEAELVRTVLSTSSTFAAVLLALVTMFLVLRQSGRLGDMGTHGLRPYFIVAVVLTFLVVLAVITSMVAFFYLVGNEALYTAAISLYLATLVSVVAGAIIALFFAW